MIRTLALIAGAALVLSIASLAGAAALGGADLRRHGWTWVITDDEPGDSSFHVRRGEPGPEVSRTLEWNGGERLVISLPGQVTYVQGPEAGVTVTGPQNVADRVQLVDGRLSLDDDPDGERGHVRWNAAGISVWSETERLRITVTAPAVKAFAIEGGGDLDIQNYDQETLEARISGSGDIAGTGRTGTLTLNIDGSGEADLSELVATDATVEISGSGEAYVAPTGAADLSINGSGEISLATRPASLRSNISGSGEIHEGA